MTYRTIGIEIDDTVYQRAVSRAVGESKTINQVLAKLLQNYAGTTATPASPSRPAAAPMPASSSPPAAVQSVYVVQSGDTLGAIARRVYGNARFYPLIQRANNIQDPRRIWVGQRLVIPPSGGTASPAAPTPAPAPVAPTPQPQPRPQPTAMPQPQPQPVPTPSSGGNRNPRPPFRFVGSPNYNRRPRGEISAIVIHATANGTLQGVVSWFNNPNAQASAHYTIDKDGTTVQHVQDRNRAWHAGVSSWQGRPNLNDWSLGIELVNWNNGEDPFPEAQHQANVNLVAHLGEKYNVKPEFIVAHYDVSPNRKTDPRGYDMNRLRREVAARL